MKICKEKLHNIIGRILEVSESNWCDPVAKAVLIEDVLVNEGIIEVENGGK